MKAATVLLSAVLAVTFACTGERITSPQHGRALRDCDSKACLDPVIDFISPSASNYTILDIHGNPISTQSPTFVCVYGTGLEGGTVYFDGSPISTESTGCGDLMFTAPVTAPGEISVQVVTYGVVSNTVYFTRH